MNENIENILKEIRDSLSNISSMRYTERANFGELQMLKGKIEVLKALAETEYDNIPVSVLAKTFGWEMEVTE